MFAFQNYRNGEVFFFFYFCLHKNITIKYPKYLGTPITWNTTKMANAEIELPSVFNWLFV